MTKPDSTSVKSITQIAGRIRFLEGFKEEYLKRKDPKYKAEVKKLKVALKELYWVLGVKQK